MSTKRPDYLLKELSALPAGASTECEQHVRLYGASMSPEALVHVVRRAGEAGNTTLRELCGLVLHSPECPPTNGGGKHPVDAVLWAVASRFGFTTMAADLDLFWERSLIKMWRDIDAGWERKPFWECDFRLCLRGVGIDVARPLFAQRSRMVKLDPKDLSGSFQNEASIIEGIESEQVLQAIRRLPAAEGHAAMLHYIDGFSIDGKQPDTVSTLMNISPRQVHTLLTRAKRSLALDPILRALHRDI